MVQRAGGPVRPVEEFLSGVRVFAEGVAFSVRRPRLLALGLVPAAIAFVLLAAAVGIVLVFIRAETSALTWFAEGWAPWLHTLLRVLAGVALVGVVGVLAIIVFTALTLAIGDPFYERISQEVDEELGVRGAGAGGPWWRGWLRGIGDSARLAAFAAAVGVVLFLAGFLPLLGQTVVPVVGALFGGWVLALELTGNAFDRRGLALAGRREVLRGHRWTAVGFGTSVFIGFMIPLGAVLLMPAGVAGATLLAHRTSAGSEQDPAVSAE